MQSKRLILESRSSAPFTFLLVTLLLLLLIHPIFRGWRHGALLFQIFFSLILFSGILSVGRARLDLTLGLILAVPAFGLRWAAHATGDETLILLSLALQAGFLAFVAVVILRHVLRTDAVSLDTIVGGVCVYLLLALIWGSLYAIIETYAPGSFHDAISGGSPDAAGHGRSFEQAYYFSVVTLTTLGYGDIAPLSSAARGLASVEAMVGQLYIAVFVARLVGLHTTTKKERGND